MRENGLGKKRDISENFYYVCVYMCNVTIYIYIIFTIYIRNEIVTYRKLVEKYIFWV